LIIILVVITALGPANWQPRTGLGWEIDHVFGYFAITLIVCFAWPRPFVVGGALMVFSALLEGLQALKYGITMTGVPIGNVVWHVEIAPDDLRRSAVLIYVFLAAPE
jgi:hypothetical protein